MTRTRLTAALFALTVVTVASYAVRSLQGCAGDDRPRPVPGAEAIARPLSELPFAELVVPPDSRGGVEPPIQIPVEGPWRYVGSTRKDMHKYAAPIPIRPRGLFFHRPQPGSRLTTADGTEVRYDRFGKSDTFMWAHDRSELIVYFPQANGPPTPGQFVLEYPRATDRERQLNLRWSGHREGSPSHWVSYAEEPERFVWTTIQDDWDNRRGLLLPAPGMASWNVEIPPAGELHFVSGLVEPEIRVGDPSDGARIVVEVELDGKVEPVLTTALPPRSPKERSFRPQRVDLSRWAGKTVRLRVKTEAVGTATYDYVFLAEPVIASRSADPVRVVMVFVDTLRPDHMSLYGYERDTTAAIDHLKAEAAVFTHARTVAPWTLPSARSIVTGRHPEFYATSPTVQELLRERGWATGFIAGNVYLSVNFDMHRDWEFHRVGLWPPAKEATDDALQWLSEHDGRNGLLQVHYMSPHLPYVEPASYRRKYAGDTPPELREEFHLSDVRKARIDDDKDAQQYVRDRYDNNVRYATDQIQRIIDVLDENDVLLLYSDHGEEFWEHQGFEHGHTLYEELLDIPLVVRAPGVTAATIDAPVSVLDLTPTILDLVGVPLPAELDGRSLAPLMRGEAGAATPFEKRDLAFGRPLYGTERWGVLHENQKWSTHEGREWVFDLTVDPGERKNLLPQGGSEAFYGYLERSLGRDVGIGYRLIPTNHRGGAPIPGLWTLCSVPGGFSSAWKADDPLENSEATVRRIEGRAEILARLAEYRIADHPVAVDAGAVEICWHSGLFGSREVYVVPKEPLADVGHKMVCSAYLGGADGGKSGTMRIPADRDPSFDAPRTPALAKLSLDQRQLSWQFGLAPIPDERTQALIGRDDEMKDMLEAIGYIDPEKPEDGSHDEAPHAIRAPCEPPRDP